MRNAQALMLGFVVAAGAFTSGCKGSGTDGAVGSSEARLVISVNAAATIHVSAVDEANAIQMVDQTIDVKGGQATMIPILMTPSRYSFDIDVSGPGVQTGHVSTKVNLKDGETAVVTLVVQADNPSTPRVTVDMAPRISAVDVQLKGGLGNNQRVEVSVDATDVDSDRLSYFWSGDGISGAVEGSSTLDIPATTAADGLSVVHVVVQDPEGASASATIALVISETEAHGVLKPGSGASHAASACQQAHAQCQASCAPAVGLGTSTVSADGSCMVGCGQALAACEAP